MIDSTEEALARSRKFTEQWCEKEISKNKMTNEERYAFLERFSYFKKLDDLRDVDFVVEAVNEDFDIKKKIFE